MIYKTIESRHAVWVSTENSFDRIRANFIKKKGGSGFEKDFRIRNRFVDEDHAVSLWLPEGNMAGFEYMVEDVLAACEKRMRPAQITYIFALEDFDYDAGIQENEVLTFLGNLNLRFRIRDWAAERSMCQGG
ncbi:MAG: hypothetical protein ABN482_06210 [Corticimicrobacter sp.]